MRLVCSPVVALVLALGCDLVSPSGTSADQGADREAAEAADAVRDEIQVPERQDARSPEPAPVVAIAPPEPAPTAPIAAPEVTEYDRLADRLTAESHDEGDEARPVDAAGWSARGDAQHRAKDYASAMRAHARAARLESDAWEHPYAVARAAALAEAKDDARVALAEALRRDYPAANEAAWTEPDFASIRRERWFASLLAGEVSLGLGGAPDWSSLGFRLSFVQARVLETSLSHGGRVKTLDPRFSVQRLTDDPGERALVWTATCKSGEAFQTELLAFNRLLFLSHVPKDERVPRGRPIFGLFSGGDFDGEVDACELSFYVKAPDADAQHVQTYCWVPSATREAMHAREGRCLDFQRAPGPAVPIQVRAASGELVAPEWSGSGWRLDHRFELQVGTAAGRWQSLALQTTCWSGGVECKKPNSVGDDVDRVRRTTLGLARSGEIVRLGIRQRLRCETAPDKCRVDLGLRGPHDPTKVSFDPPEHVARYCWQPGRYDEATEC